MSSPEPTAADRPRRRFEIHPPVFWTSVALTVLFVGLGVVHRDVVAGHVESLQSAVADHAGWLYVLAANLILGLIVYLLASRHGTIRLGGPDCRPEFSRWSWFAMLFSAGMGIGLVFYGVAEPIHHFTSPPRGDGGSAEAAARAMRLTFFHWGFHAWAIYALVGLTLAFFAFNRGLPLAPRSAFHPLLGERIHGPWGDAVDVLAVLATLFGLATSLGLGAQQINAGLAHLFAVPEGTGTQVPLIAAITAIAVISVVLGLDRGIRRLSQVNMVLALVLLAAVFILGPTVFLAGALVQNLGSYLQHLPELSTWTETYRGTSWQNGWTIFYWAWWIAWSPFVGTFIARISRGRTVRELLLGVLLAPTLATFVWLTVFGGTALHQELFAAGGISEAVAADLAVGLFALLERLPAAFPLSLLAIIVVTTFFITSSDSASLVIDMIASGGRPDPPVAQRVFWALSEGAIAAVLLLGGGLKALQTASITTGLPFALVLLAMGASLMIELRRGESASHSPARLSR